jgi:hypothetical protein
MPPRCINLSQYLVRMLLWTRSTPTAISASQEMLQDAQREPNFRVML